MRKNDERLTLADINWLTEDPTIEYVAVVAYERTASASVGFTTEADAIEWLKSEGSIFGQREGDTGQGALRFKGVVRRHKVETLRISQDWTEEEE